MEKNPEDISAALRKAIGSSIDPVDQTHYEGHIGELKAQLPGSKYDLLWQEGGDAAPADVLFVN